jgi:hypothetical protein
MKVFPESRSYNLSVGGIQSFSYMKLQIVNRLEFPAIQEFVFDVTD